MSKILNYAVWFELNGDVDGKINKGLRCIYDELMQAFEIEPSVEFKFEDMIFKVGKNFYLIRVEEHFSPGDIAGLLKKKFLDDSDQVMAILISSEYYIPYQGMVGVSRNDIHEWSSFSQNHVFRRKSK